MRVRLEVAVILLIVLGGPIAIALARASSIFDEIRHVVILVMENQPYDEIIGASVAPFENQLASQYALASRYYAVGHPSLPNYLVMIAGDYFNFGLKDESPPEGGLNYPNIVDLFEAQGISWKAYVQDLPSHCYLRDRGNYTVHHNPFVYFHDIQSNPARCNRIVELDQFSLDLAQNDLPNFSFIVPNNFNNGHNTGSAYGDRWLSKFVPAIIQSSSFSSTVLFVVYDEGSEQGGFVSGNYKVAGGHVVCLAVSPLVKRGFQSDKEYSHYSLLATVESIFDIGNLGRGDAVMAPMTDLFASNNSRLPVFESSTVALVLAASVAVASVVVGVIDVVRRRRSALRS